MTLWTAVIMGGVCKIVRYIEQICQILILVRYIVQKC